MRKAREGESGGRRTSSLCVHTRSAGGAGPHTTLAVYAFGFQSAANFLPFAMESLSSGCILSNQVFS